MSIGRRRAPYASQLRRLVVAAHTRIATPPSISHEPVITITSHPDKCAAPATIRSAPKLSMLSAEMTSQNTGAATMNRYHKLALARHCRLSVETMHPQFARKLPGGLTVVLTVNSGYE